MSITPVIMDTAQAADESKLLQYKIHVFAAVRDLESKQALQRIADLLGKHYQDSKNKSSFPAERYESEMWFRATLSVFKEIAGSGHPQHQPSLISISQSDPLVHLLRLPGRSGNRGLIQPSFHNS
jgi:hypothetical protein